MTGTGTERGKSVFSEGRERYRVQKGMTCRDIKRIRDDREIQRKRGKKRQWLRGRDRKENKR